MKTLCVVVLLGVLTVVTTLRAGEPEERVIVRPRVFVGPGEEPLFAPPEPEALGRSVRLKFRLEPGGEKSGAVELLAATTRYAAELSNTAGESGFEFSIKGTLRIIRPDQVLVAYELVAVVRSPEATSRASLQGSVVIRSGEEKAVATFGDKSLIISAAFDEGEVR